MMNMPIVWPSCIRMLAIEIFLLQIRCFCEAFAAFLIIIIFPEKLSASGNCYQCCLQVVGEDANHGMQFPQRTLEHREIFIPHFSVSMCLVAICFLLMRFTK